MRTWRVAVPVVAACAGLIFTTTAVASKDGELRNDRGRLTDLIKQQQDRAAVVESRYAELRARMDIAAAAAAEGDARVGAIRSTTEDIAVGAGLTPVTGPGVQVSLDDAPVTPGEPLPRGAEPNDLVIHEQDVQAVVNALWAGGAEAMTIMGERVIATTAVRCVGNTLLLHGRVYSPPFTVAAIGEPNGLQAALDEEPNLQVLSEYVAAYDLGFAITEERALQMPAYDGPLGLNHAQAGFPSPSATP